MDRPAHIITERQKKGALSSVKKPKLPKNVIVKNDINYWPTLDEKQSETFVKLLETFCNENNKSSFISLGLESTLRSLKQNKVQLLVIANEISPNFFGKHLIAMALNKNHNIQIIIVPKLKDISRQLLKVPTIVFSIKQTEDISCLDEFYKSLCIHSELQKQYCIIRPAIDVSIKKKKVKKLPDYGPPVVLLKKSSNDSRSFVPEDAEDSTKTETTDSSDYISLSKFKITSSTLTTSKVPSYRPLKIAKIVGNSNRKKKS